MAAARAVLYYVHMGSSMPTPVEEASPGVQRAEAPVLSPASRMCASCKRLVTDEQEKEMKPEVALGPCPR